MGTTLASHLVATVGLTCVLLAVLSMQRLAWGLRRMARRATALWDGRERRTATQPAAPWPGPERRRHLTA